MELLGGAAHLNGVSFESENYRVTTRLKKGEIKTQYLKKEKKISTLESMIRKIPFIRGYWVLISVFINNPFILMAVLLNQFLKSTNNNNNITEIVSLLILLTVIIFIGAIIIGPIKNFHGAEHKVANTFWDNAEVTLAETQKRNTVSNSCGTNLVVFILLTAWCLYLVGVDKNYISFLSFPIAYEIFRFKGFSPFYFIGGILQKYLFTKEPSEQELKIALTAFEELKKLETNSQPHSTTEQS